ncbi:MAG: flavin reductase family protein [Acidobacteriota bacterium]
MSILPDVFRDVLRRFAAGVTVVTSARDGVRLGLTVTAFTSVSVEPPLIAVVIQRDHRITPLLQADDASFAVNLLSATQQPLSDRFAYVKDEDRFTEGTWTTAETGAPVLQDALAWLDCRLHGRLDAGTHTIYVGRVVAAAVPSADATQPLVYCDRAYYTLTPPA